MNMRKCFVLIRATNWKLSCLYQLRRFQNRNLWYTVQTLFARKQGFAKSYFLHENESLQHCLSSDMRQMATLLVLSVLF